MHLSRLTFPLACLLAVVAASVAIAHSDAEKPRFVAKTGVDEGRCDDPASPCATIGYALRQTGKGSQVLVASGAYEISDPADIFYIVSGTVDVRGGFSAANAYRLTSNAPTTLIGVPREYRAQLASRGFSIVADTKSYGDEVLEETEKFLGMYAASKTSLGAAPCVGGQSAGLDCLNTELLSRLALSSVSASPGSAADVWGFTDLNTHREYTIVGFSTGTGVFDVSDPENPVEIGFIDGQATTWRDIKVYQFFNAAENRWNAYAYVVADSTTDGLYVIDLTELPHRVFRSGAFTNRFFSAHNVFVTNIDYGTGLALQHAAPTLIVAGSNNDGGRFRSFSLANPANPQEIAVASGANLYMHDAASTVITDSRRNQCQNETPTYCELLFDFNEGSVVTWDITVPASPVLLSEIPYAAVGYTHSGWVSEDNQYLFVHDELDEGRTVANTTVRVFSLADVSTPSFVSSWVSNNITT
ncbi:MAG: choice-of-anchor B family protein, partial [Gammaproteobacteria bacterium]|nr:choice-of-anchor B family protein [Gammaproteobacteria bacterium]